MLKSMIATCALALGGMFGFGQGALGHSVAPPRVHESRSEQPVSAEVLCHGMSPSLEYDIIPVRTLRSGTGEQLDVDLAFKSRFKAGAKVAYSILLADDVGHIVAGPINSSVRRLAGASGAFTARYRSPEQLPDGYYQLVVKTVAVADDGEEIAVEPTMYLSVQRGAITVIDHDEWAHSSRANLPAEQVTP